MAFVRWSRRRARRTLRRDLSKFEVRLPSSMSGIAFTALITATVTTAPPYPQRPGELAAAIRDVLRNAASDVAAACDPADLSWARDICGRHLARRRCLPTDPPVEFHATLKLGLLPDDQSAVTALLAAQRQQAVADALRQQKTDATAQELSRPAAVLARWIEGQPNTWNGLPDLTAVQKIADAFAEHRPARERAVEYAALEIVRDFLNSFQDPPQRRMLYEVLAASMHHTKRPGHAAQAEALLDEHPPTTGPVSGA